MPRKSNQTAADKERGSSSTLEGVKHFLQSDTIPDGYSKNDKRALRRRAKSFVLIKDQLYFTGGRSRHNKSLLEGVTDEAENPENEPDHTQVLRKVLFSAEEQQDAVDRAHIAEDGSHYGMEKTTERVSNSYYWMGITFTVRNTIHSCVICSSRSKNLLTGFQPNTGLFAVSLPPTSTTPAAIVSVTPAPNPDAVGLVDGESLGDGGDTVDVDVGDLNEDLDTGSEPLQLAHPSIIKKESEKQATDGFYVPKDVCSYFWQKVEVQIFGPYRAGKQQMYIAVALDTYSQFPDATTMEILSPATLTHFILNLFCRYGVMEKLLLLQSQVTKNKEYYLNKSVLEAGISPVVLFPQASSLDERWRRVKKNLDDFVEKHPDFWFHCLEAFMVPLRISLPPEADYSPYFLAHGREPPVPAVLSRICNITPSVCSELKLTEEQEKQTVESVMSAYGILTDDPSIPFTSSQQLQQGETRATVETLSKGDEGHVTRLHLKDDVKDRKANRKRLWRSGTMKEEGEVEAGRKGVKEAEEKEREESSGEHFDDWEEPQDDSDRDVTYEPVRPMRKKTCKEGTLKKIFSEQMPTRSSRRERKATLKAQETDLFIKKERSLSLLPKQKAKVSQLPRKQAVPKTRSRIRTKACVVGEKQAGNQVGHTDKTIKQTQGKSTASKIRSTKGFTLVKRKKINHEKNVSILNKMQQLPLDTFYFILRQYKENGSFPPGVSDETKQIVSLRGVVEVKSGKLYSCLSKSSGRLIIMEEKNRVGVLRKAHARGEEHHGRNNALKYLTDMNVFWKGMSLDLDAFIHACPECFIHNPLHNQSVVKIPSKSAVLSADGRGVDENHLSEDEGEECSYEDLTQYLKELKFPATSTPQQQFYIKQRSELFRIMDGSLYYAGVQNPTSDSQRQVLLSPESRSAAICEAHIEDGKHLSQQDTQEKLRRKFYWSGMTFDVTAHVLGCCMSDALFAAAAVPHRNPNIQSRVNKLHQYYTDKTVPKLDTSLLTCTSTCTEGNKTGPEMLVRDSDASNDKEKVGVTGACEAVSSEKQSQPSGSVLGEGKTEAEVDPAVIKAIETIVEDIGGSLSREEKPAGHKGSNNGGVDRGAKQAQVANLRKDAHKCQYCGVFISGNVAYRVHLYKHTGVKPYSCATCGKTFTTSKSLHVHKRKHTGIKPYLCNQCGREFFRSTSFKYHLKTHTRTKGKPLPCDLCSREFLTQNRLDKHKEFKHPTVPKVYMCNYCGKVFNAARSLKWHEQSHTNPRKYHCPVCGKDFARKDHLDAHARASHTNEELEPHNIAPKPQRSVAQPPQEQQTDHQLQEHHMQQLLPQFLQQAVDGGQQQQQQQQHVQLQLQNVEIPASNISVIQWSQEQQQQATSHIALADHHGPTQFTISSGDHITVSEHQLVTDIESYQAHSASQTLPHTTVHILTQGQLPLPVSIPQPQPSLHLPVSSVATTSHLQNLHTLQQAVVSDAVLKQEAVPVGYEVECMSGDTSSLTQDDLNAVQLLAHASLGNHILHTDTCI